MRCTPQLAPCAGLGHGAALGSHASLWPGSAEWVEVPTRQLADREHFSREGAVMRDCKGTGGVAQAAFKFECP